jgi:hypothetical protein
LIRIVRNGLPPGENPKQMDARVKPAGDGSGWAIATSAL